MIYESSDWKKELKKELRTFRKFLDKKNNQDYDDKYNLKVEKFFFVTSYIIRKLLEAKKLSDEIEFDKIDFKSFKRTDPNDILDHMRTFRIYEQYDLNNPSDCQLSLCMFCNIFIHSFIFVPAFDDDNKLDGIYVNTDRSKNKCLYYIELNSVFSIIYNIINDFIVSMTFERDDQGGFLKYKKSKFNLFGEF